MAFNLESVNNHTSFPEKIDDVKYKNDIDIDLLPSWKEYMNLIDEAVSTSSDIIRHNKLEEANEILNKEIILSDGSKKTLKDCNITSDDYNALQDKIYAIQVAFNSRDVKQETMLQKDKPNYEDQYIGHFWDKEVATDSNGEIYVNQYVKTGLGTIESPYKYTKVNIENGTRVGSSAGVCSSVDGNNNSASGYSSHSEGYSTSAQRSCSHSEGLYTTVLGEGGHSEGLHTTVLGKYASTKGSYTTAHGENSYAEGCSNTSAYVRVCEVMEADDKSYEDATIDEIIEVRDNGEGLFSLAYGMASHVEGMDTLALGEASHAEGYNTKASGEDSHAEGNKTTASGVVSHAEGSATNANGDYAHAEGCYTTASGNYSHAENAYTEARGQYSHAEGYDTEANGGYSHVEGYQSIANKDYSHAEGFKGKAYGKGSHAEGCYTIASGEYQHVEGKYNVEDTGNIYAHIIGGGVDGSNKKNIHTVDWNGNAIYTGKVEATDFVTQDGSSLSSLLAGDTVHSGNITATDFITKEGISLTTISGIVNKDKIDTVASGNGSHAEGYYTAASGNYSHAEGYKTTVNGICSHVEGYYTAASGNYSHAEGYKTTVNGDYSHAEGKNTVASYASHAEGSNTTANGSYSHSEGESSNQPSVNSSLTADSVLTAWDEETFLMSYGEASHAEGYDTLALGYASHAEGKNTKAYGSYSHAEGYDTTAYGDFSHASGSHTSAANNQFVIGHFNQETENSSSTGASETISFAIGNGTSASGNTAFSVSYDGYVVGSSFYNYGSDYAEFCEWEDKNINNEERLGFFVTDCGISNDGKSVKIKKAKSGDYIYGIVSSNPGVVGNANNHWQGKYLTDEWGNYIKEEVTEKINKHRINEETGELEEYIDEILVETYKLNPDYDSTKTYIQRENRQEWDTIGMVGILTVRDDGTCIRGGWCCSNDEGIATNCERKQFDTFRVIDRISDNLIKVRIG